MRYLKYINSFNLISEGSSSIGSILDFDFDIQPSDYQNIHNIKLCL